MSVNDYINRDKFWACQSDWEFTGSYPLYPFTGLYPGLNTARSWVEGELFTPRNICQVVAESIRQQPGICVWCERGMILGFFRVENPGSVSGSQYKRGTNKMEIPL